MYYFNFHLSQTNKLDWTKGFRCMCLPVCQYVPILIPHFNALMGNGLDLVLLLYIFLSQLNSRIIVAMQTRADLWCVHNIALYWWFMDQFLPKFAHCQQSYDPLNFETNPLLFIKHIRFPLSLILYLLGIFSVTSWYCRSRLTKNRCSN